MEQKDLEQWLTREQQNIIDVKNRVTAIEAEQKELREDFQFFLTRKEFNDYREKARTDFAFKDGKQAPSLLDRLLMWATKKK